LGASFAGASVGSGAFGCALSAVGAAAVASSFSAFAGAFALVFSSAGQSQAQKTLFRQSPVKMLK